MNMKNLVAVLLYGSTLTAAGATDVTVTVSGTMSTPLVTVACCARSVAPALNIRKR